MGMNVKVGVFCVDVRAVCRRCEWHFCVRLRCFVLRFVFLWVALLIVVTMEGMWFGKACGSLSAK